MPAMNGLPAIYEVSTLDPPASHMVAWAIAAIYGLLLLGFVVAWLDARAAERRAIAERSHALKEGPGQLLGTIGGSARILGATGDGNRVVEVPVEPFTLETDAGPVRIAPAGPVTFDAGRLQDRPLRGGESVEIAGELGREKLASVDGYRGEATEGWVLREPATGEGVRLWRFSRASGPSARRRSWKGGILMVLACGTLSALSLTGFLARAALGETTEATLVSLEEPTRKGAAAVIELGDESIRVRFPADEVAGLEPGPIAYRRVAALPSLGAVGPGAAIPGSALFFALIFLVVALAGGVAIVATHLEGR